ncbi:MAG: hypothetical protein P8X90_28390 [Desulfobacterales bacterium]|jgi:hypothetical protein
MAIRDRLRTFRLAIEELEADLEHASGADNRHSAAALEKEISNGNLRALLEESETEWEELKSEVEADFTRMRNQIDSLEASLRSERKSTGEPADRKNSDRT